MDRLAAPPQWTEWFYHSKIGKKMTSRMSRQKGIDLVQSSAKRGAFCLCVGC